jgi:hypothetical protein
MHTLSHKTNKTSDKAAITVGNRGKSALTVLEFAGSDQFQTIYDYLDMCASVDHIVFDKNRLLECSIALLGVSMNVSGNDYMKMRLECLSRQLVEIAEKEQSVDYNSLTWRRYHLDDSLIGVLLFVLLFRDRAFKQKVYKGVFEPIQDHSMTLKQATKYFNVICRELNIQARAIPCGSIRRECLFV